MAKKRKAGAGRSEGPSGPNMDVGASKKIIRDFEDVADSDDEFHINRDRVLLDEGPQAKRRRKAQEQEEFLEPSDVEVLGGSDEEEDSEEAYEEDVPVDDSEQEEGGRRGEYDEEEEELPWGTSKEDLYGADAIETEEQALEEEAEALRLQKKQLRSMTAADYGFDESKWQDAGDEKASEDGDVVTEKLPQLQIAPDMSHAERLKLLKSRYPEFEPLSKELLGLREVHGQLVKDFELRDAAAPQPNAEAKLRAASAYFGSLTMYFALLTSPASDGKANAVAMPATQLRDHPLMDTLVACRELWLRAKELPSDISRVGEIVSESEDEAMDERIEMVVPKKNSHKSRTERHAEAAAAATNARRAEKMRKIEADLADLGDLTAPSRAKKATRKKRAQDEDSDIGEEAPLTAQEAAEKAKHKKSLRFYTSQIAQKANKRGAAGRNAGGDDDIPYRERLRDRQARLNAEAEKRGRKDVDARAELGGESDEEDAQQARVVRAGAEDDDYYDLVAARTAKKKSEKAALAEAQKQAALQGGQVVQEELVGPDGKRKISYAIEKNKGLTPHRKKDVRNPRVKKRKKFDEKKKKLGSIKPVYKGGEGRGGYGGELTGIKKGLVKTNNAGLQPTDAARILEPYTFDSLGMEAFDPSHSITNSIATVETTYERIRRASSMNTILFFLAISAALPTLLYLYREYLAHKSLGPGGTPQTIAGFLRVFVLGFAKVSNPYELPKSYEAAIASCSHLQKLPSRAGPRPETRGIAPHRQVTQKGSVATYDLLVDEIERLGSSSRDLCIGTSCFEKHSTGLFALHPVNDTCAGEICHTHPSDGGSMHLTLHPANVKVVLEAGWGERHPLSRGGWFERFVPAGFVMVYAPRDEREVRTVVEIVGAAAWFVCDGDCHEGGDHSVSV